MLWSVYLALGMAWGLVNGTAYGWDRLAEHWQSLRRPWQRILGIAWVVFLLTLWPLGMAFVVVCYTIPRVRRWVQRKSDADL
jgi:hypothetical protein